MGCDESLQFMLHDSDNYTDNLMKIYPTNAIFFVSSSYTYTTDNLILFQLNTIIISLLWQRIKSNFTGHFISN